MIGIHYEESGRKIWDLDVIANYADDIERWIDIPAPEEAAGPTTKKAIAHHRRHRWGTGREIQDSREGTRPALTREEWDAQQ